MLVAYVSGHGFGHSTRVGEVLRAVRRREPLLPLAVVTSAPEHLYRAAVDGEISYRRLECDVGVAQPDALVIDEAETVRRWRVFQAGAVARIAAEADWLRRSGARLVLGDVPPLAFAAAAAAGIPGVALANFSWDWVYRHLARRYPALEEAALRCAEAYSQARLLLELPFAGDLSVFPRREAIPLVARRPRLPRAETRRRLGVDGRATVLVSFGGLGFPGFSLDVLATLPEYLFVVGAEADAAPANVRFAPASALAERGLQFADLVGAADVVVSKPGYGIVTDAIASRVRLVYTDRGDFPEYPILVREMAQWLPCAYVSHEELREGRLRPALESVMAVPFPAAPDLTGAEVAAEKLLALLGP